MIVKFLRKSETFSGLRYNSNKFESDKGELMLVSGFGALQGLDHMKPSDYINYLEAMSSRSSRIKFPQLHVVISAKGHSHTGKELTTIAADWMEGMGYGEQPYIVVYHKDTDNAHVHIVSTRIDRSGKKINDSFEHRRAYQVLNRIMAVAPAAKFEKDVAETLAYRFSTRPQFEMVLEARGYQVRLQGEDYLLFKYGELMGKVPLAAVEQRIAAYQKDSGRISQLRAIVLRYQSAHSGAVYPVSRPLPGGISGPAYGYGSDLADLLRQKLGLEVLYHGSPGKAPYGFSVLDHAEKLVLKGKELMDLQEFLRPAYGVYDGLVVAAPDLDLSSGVDSAGAEVRFEGGAAVPGEFLRSGLLTDCDPDEERTGRYLPGYSENPFDAGTVAFEQDYTAASGLDAFRLDISDDVDDEQVLGPTRRRKRKARTNTR
ncbi:relaxase/mobilization nuclease domain-containing protein [Pedobacter sp. GR22-6]|uniref:relaxase/mobilization nuclease domain-containing protein n=1 Tax=Pedobacter sp. GR22-6 TaxID=3127957 RepID=UPI00307E25D7